MLALSTNFVILGIIEMKMINLGENHESISAAAAAYVLMIFSSFHMLTSHLSCLVSFHATVVFIVNACYNMPTLCLCVNPVTDRRTVDHLR